MGSNNEVTQEQLNELVEDASYLEDEAEALKYVIEEVPYTESPPDDRSIAEKLLIIDHAQLSYYRPILEKGFKSPRPTRLEDFEHFSETFEVDEEKLKDIQKLLSKIAKHRAGLVNVIKNIPLIDWDKTIFSDDREITLFDFMQQMVHFDRSMLKDIADQVMVYSQDREAQREIESRKKNHQQS